MTLIIAAVENGKVHMMGDGFTGFGNTKQVDTRKKVWTHDGMVLGAAGNVRPILTFRYGFTWPEQKPEQDEDTYMRFVFPAALREFMKEHVPVSDDGDGENCRMALLVGRKGRLWAVGNDFAVTESEERFDAIGSGDVAALSTLAVLKAPMPCEARLRTCLLTVARYFSTIAPPYAYVVEP